MVCFHIVLAYPEEKRNVINVLNEKRIKHLCRSYNADLFDQYTSKGVRYIYLAACDADAVCILRDVPPSIYCVFITILRSNTLVYTHSKLTKERTTPPRDLLLKRVYWTASQLEKRCIDCSVPTRI